MASASGMMNLYPVSRRGAGLIYRHDIGNLFRFPKMLLWGNAHHHLSINYGREARKLTFGCQLTSPGWFHSTNMMKTQSNNIIQIQPSREVQGRVPAKNDEVEDRVEGEVEDTHNPFEDSKEAFEDATMGLGEDRGEAEPLSLENLFLSKRNLRAC
ncbi:hypothetical protein Cgig2_010949 [Carnegiea gigantea]|uniref:Uncharacterized protein n=1 Tax=Carnegiea gigantea TaxID=171969 RepID=A0A9Q1K0D2_9CARY|nr:hypothetical protein Cgig2_010949 [Carnegiea gigantea]